ncbi:relaxase/mobilization nuclease domain-containing protein [Sedimentibacter sp. MB31-C6]|uniref:relaxase/mobilization nuclease domain-containing protein n=1 Tax=Sedimentibacter sp. MB31-C6 TaxID=3109366 RepID=UPI002DDCEF3A|nr:relaxase/mobilization nuclease domain-containing protein [Sedimentibacter sp. MB36-C1]WSI05120.1 relaxase/mobilization nuclease domain-containing protein [Sedimentibacter sp. MB36-C1]
MAYVKRHPIHKTLKNALKYIENIEKTDDKLLVSSNKCSINENLAIEEMKTLKKQYEKEDGIQGFHFIQSFKPGEANKEKAHQVGREWAEKFLDGKYQYVLTTHVDKGHIHNHIIINSVGLNGKKYNSCKNELEDIRKYSDLVCLEHGLSVIEPNRRNKNKSYKEWQESKNKTSWKDIVREDIDYVISSSESFEDFIRKMKSEGYYIKHGNVKYMTFKKQGMNRAVRGKTLGIDYDEHSIKQRIKFKEHNIRSFRSKNKKYYKIDKKSFEYQIRKLSYRQSSLETNIKLIILLFKIIFNNNQNSFEKDKRPIKYTYAQKKAINGIKDLSSKLNLLHKYNLHTRGDVQKQIDILNGKIKQVETKKEKLKTLEIKMEAVCTEIELYYKYKKYHDEYERVILKGVYKKKNAYEIEKFESCKNRLEKFSLKDELQYENFINQRNEVIEKTKGVDNEINNTFKELDKILGLQNYLNKYERDKFIKDIQLETKMKDENEKER